MNKLHFVQNIELQTTTFTKSQSMVTHCHSTKPTHHKIIARMHQVEEALRKFRDSVLENNRFQQQAPC